MIPRLSAKRLADYNARFDGPIKSLNAIYRRATADALEILSKSVPTLFARQRAAAQLREYHRVLDRLGDEAAAWIEKNLPAAYGLGVQLADEEIKQIRRAGINLNRTREEIFATVHKEAVAAIAGELQRTTDFALAQIGRRVDDVFRRVGIEEVAKGIAEGLTRVDITRNIKDRLLAEGKPFFLDKAGRKWDLDRYSEMVAVTTRREAMTQGTINRLLEHKIHLAQVSAHNAADFCIYYENVIVNIGSTPHPDYPPLSAISGGAPFHPRCAHSMHAFVEELASNREKQQGKIDTDLLNKSPAVLQRRFRRDFPERARAQGRRLMKQAGRGRGKMKKPRKTTAKAGPLPTREQFLERIRPYEDQIATLKREKCFIFSPQGEVVFSKVGGASSIKMKTSDLALLEGRVFSHNHPSGASFSPDDVRTSAAFNAAEVRAVGRTGKVYSMRPPPDGWPDNEAMAESYNRHNTEVRAENLAAIARKELTPEAAMFNHPHQVWERFSADFGIIYEVSER